MPREAETQVVGQVTVVVETQVEVLAMVEVETLEADQVTAEAVMVEVYVALRRLLLLHA
jgi:hypothetical protein